MLSSDSSIRTVTSAYAYCSGLYYMKIRQIGAGHIKDAMNHGYVIETRGKNKGQRKYASPCTQERIKSMCNLMFDYALERNLVLTNPARAFKIDKLLREIEQKAKKKKPFSPSDVELLWEYHEMIPFADIVLIGIYSGFRPQELVLLRTENVFLDEGYIIGGIKTSNGIDRMVPIHPKIKELVAFRYQQATELYHSEFLLNIPYGSSFKPFTYDTYESRFHNVMDALNLVGFTPHCTRHTFTSQAEMCGLRERAIKLIMGHSLKGDVTDYHYKHTRHKYLYDQICKIEFGKGEDDNEGSDS
ncbi:MAG: tyrosine-type recombinase/integrase [Lachnospiraceae bacterium]|nr:tyrosine-type recombinase/integrase [Lachnospiraceae bacterium]